VFLLHVECVLHLLDFPVCVRPLSLLSEHGVSFANRPELSRARVFCAAKRTLDGEDDSLTLVGGGKGGVGVAGTDAVNPSSETKS